MDILDNSTDWDLKRAAARNCLARLGIVEIRIVEIHSNREKVEVCYRRALLNRSFLQRMLGVRYSDSYEYHTFTREEFTKVMEFEAQKKTGRSELM